MKLRDGAHVVLHKKTKPRGCDEEKDQVLLYKRDLNTHDCSGCWSYFGGKLDGCETPKEAVMRELIEEVCGLPKIKSTALVPLGCVTIEKDGESPTIHYFVLEFATSFAHLHLRDEGDGIALFTQEQAQRLCMRSEDRKALKLHWDPNNSSKCPPCERCSS